MNAVGNASSIRRALLGVLLVLAVGPGCDSGGPTPDPEVTVSAEAVTENGSRIDSAGIYFDGRKVGEGTAQKTYTQDSDGSVTVSAQEDDYLSAEKTVSLGADRDVSLELQQLPETATISFENRAEDGDSLIAGDVTFDGQTVASGEKSGSFSTDGSREDKPLCFQEGEFFRSSCKTITPDADKLITLQPARKTLKHLVRPTNPDDSVLADARTKISPRRHANTTTVLGEQTADLPKVSGRLVAISTLERYEADTLSVDGTSTDDIRPVLERLPKCSDGIDNDGDGYADKADTRACTDLDGNYDPEDDNEVLKGFSRVTGRLFDDSVSVSKKAGERSAKILPASSPLPWSVTVAKGEIGHRIEVQRSDSIPDQDHATHLKTGGSNDNLTVEKTSDVTADVDTANGFVLIRVHGIDRSFFADGPHYAVYGWHGCKVRDNCESIPGSGKFFYYVELSDSHLHSWSHAYEPEDVPENNQKSAYQKSKTATLKSGECIRVSETDTICHVPARSNKF